jgi:glycosyltransferase involved in cell wall biosynthesis
LLNKTPAISIVIPTHDRPRMLTAAIESAVAQTFDDSEIIVVLNGATPECSRAAERFAGHGRIHLVKIEYATVAAARNAGIERARGEWIAFLDDDDLWEERKLAAQMTAALRSGAEVVSCHFSLFDNDGPIAGSGLTPLPSGLAYPEALMLANFVSGGSAALVRSSALRSLGGFDEAMINCEDWDMWRRLSWNHAIHMVEEQLVRYRRHGTNKGLDLERKLIGEAQHFAKMLRDTPPQLQHMLGRAKRRYFASVRSILTTQALLLEPIRPFQDRSPFQLVDRMMFGLMSKVRDSVLTRSL